MKYFPHTQQDIEQMLEVAGLKSMDDLYGEIPQQLLFDREFALPEAMSEVEVRRFFEALGKKNASLACFAGAGVEDHYSPSVIAPILSAVAVVPSYIEALVTSIPVSSQIIDWYSKIYCNVPCEISG